MMPFWPSSSARTAAAPKRSPSRRSNDVGEPPRNRCPSTTVRDSLPVSCSSSSGDLRPDATQSFGVADAGADEADRAADGHAPSATTTIENLAPRLLALGDRRGHRFERERDLGDEDRVSTRRGAGLRARSNRRSGPSPRPRARDRATWPSRTTGRCTPTRS